MAQSEFHPGTWKPLAWLSYAVILCGTSLQAGDFNVKPYLQSVTKTSVVVCWESLTSHIGTVAYGTTTSYGKTAKDPGQVKMHQIKLSGLKENTRYYYEALSGTMTLSGSFRTAPGWNDPFRIAVYGDNKNGLPHIQVVNTMVPYKPDLLVHVGDLLDNGNVRSQYKNQFFDRAAPVLKDTPLYTAIGNHEYLYEMKMNPPFKNFRDYMVHPEDILHGGKEERYFTFQYGNSFCIVVDTDESFAPNTHQSQWLKSKLMSAECQNAQFRLLFMHHAPWCWDWHGGEARVRQYVVPMAENFGVDIVFSGHYHCYERGVRKTGDSSKTYYVVTGGGGAGFTKHFSGGNHEYPHMQVHAWEHHFSMLDIAGNTLSFKAINRHNQVIDQFEIVKGAPTTRFTSYDMASANAGTAFGHKFSFQTAEGDSAVVVFPEAKRPNWVRILGDSIFGIPTGRGVDTVRALLRSVAGNVVYDTMDLKITIASPGILAVVPAQAQPHNLLRANASHGNVTFTIESAIPQPFSLKVLSISGRRLWGVRGGNAAAGCKIRWNVREGKRIAHKVCCAVLTVDGAPKGQKILFVPTDP